jgi:hypothetical protein
VSGAPRAPELGVRTYDGAGETFSGWRGPGIAPAVTIGVVVVLLLWVNGRPLSESPSAGAALAGKLVSTVLAAVAAGLLFAAAGRRHPTSEAATAALVLVFGTSVWAASQYWSLPLAASAAVAAAVYCLVRAEDDDRWSERAVFFLPVAAAFDPPTIAFGLVVLAAIFARWPRRVLWLVAHVAAGVAAAFVGSTLVGGSAPVADAGALGLASAHASPLAFFLSPARGVLAFSPVALVAAFGAARTLRGPGRFLPAALAGGFLAQAILLAVAGDVEAGRTWGTVLLASAWPALLLFLPEGLAATRLVGWLLVIVSVGVQALGAFTYDQRWDRLVRTAGDRIPDTVLWDPAKSPAALSIRERVLRLAAPGRRDGHWVVNPYPVAPVAPRGSIVQFGSEGVVAAGSEPVLRDILLEGGARVEGTHLRLAEAGDGVFVRVTDEARSRRLELRVAGKGRGTVVIGERTFWTEPRWTVHPVDGTFRLRKPYYFPESGGPDVRVALSAPGSVEVTKVSLVNPKEPEDVVRLP